MKITLVQITNWITWIVTGSTVIRICLYRLPDLLNIWIPKDRPFWLTYAKLLETFDVVTGWLSGALSKFGKSNLMLPSHLEYLREQPEPPPPAIPKLDAAKEEPKQ